MDLPQDIQDVLTGLADRIAQADPTSPDAIVAIGTSLERVAGAFPSDGEAGAGVLQQCLGTLQTIYQGQAPCATAAMRAVGEAVDTVRRWVQADATDADLLRACQGIGEALEPGAQPHGEDEPAGGDPLKELNEAAGMLMSLSGADRDDLTALRDRLERVAGTPSLEAGALEHLRAAIEAIGAAVEGADADTALAGASEALGEAIVVVEAAREPAEDVEADVAAPVEAPASAPATSPAAEQSSQEWSGPAVLPDDADIELLGEFIVECIDHINGAEAALLTLETDSTDTEQINVVFRAFHTIKGTSGFMGLDRIQRCAHLAESQLDRAREGEIRIVGGYADLALKSCDALRTMIEGLEGIGPGTELLIPESLEDLLGELADPEGNGVSEEDVTSGPMRVGEILVGRGAATREDVEVAAGAQGDTPLGQKLVETGAADAGDVAKALRTQRRQGGPGATTEATIRVGTARLDSLINMVGELVIAQSMVAQDPAIVDTESERLGRNVSHAGKIIRELQDLTMALRMVPLDGTFKKMARLVRDLGRKGGKNVRFVTEGEDTEIDRNMVETLNDPLVHMIRNSVDHGIEAPEARGQTDKDSTGTVKLRAYHSAGSVVIELRDDGKGLDREKILAKAIERGLIEPSQELTDSELFALIFQAGFSTADQVTDVSGRGVGMDVVRRSIESVRGRIEVASSVGEGTTITLRLPLTMAIADGMLLRVGNERYLLPTISIEQSFRPSLDAVSTVTGRGELVQLRGDLLPIFRLHKLFDVAGATTEMADGLLIVIESDTKRCALMVDEILGQQQVVIKTLGDTFGHIPGIAGGAILGDGRVGLILDPAGLLALASGAETMETALSAA